MDHYNTTTSSSATLAGAPMPTLLGTSPPETRDPRARSRSEPKPAPDVSRARSTSTRSYHSLPASALRQGYLDSLMPPTIKEFDQIAAIQAEREAQTKRKQLELRRRSLEHDQIQSHFLQPPKDHGNPSEPLSRRSRGLSITDRLGLTRQKTDNDKDARAKAAALIQRTYRGYRVRRQLEGFGLDPSRRWKHAIREAQWRELVKPCSRNNFGLVDSGIGMLDDGGSGARCPTSESRSSRARQNWKKVATIARRVAADVDSDGYSSDSSSSSRPSSSSPGVESDEEKRKRRQQERSALKEARERRKAAARMMGLQYLLEMVDLKHRYGANLRVYHEAWKQADTDESFFFWLDHGEGQAYDLEACSREQLERERIRYLSCEERQHYLVQVDDEGRLCWAKNGERIDTYGEWKDSVHGIVPIDDSSSPYVPANPSEHETRLFGHTGTGSASSEDDGGDDAEHDAVDEYVYPPTTSDGVPTATKTIKRFKNSRHISTGIIVDKLLRKSVRRNTWIFVADTNLRLYVGIKSSGAFQHSSFLQGSRIFAAGSIKIKDGRLTSLSPLSGHYRPPTSSFRAFMRSLQEEQGVDMSAVTVSKSYSVLVGMETYAKARTKGKEAVGKIRHQKDRVLAPERYRKRQEEAKDTSRSAAREREVVRENSVGGQLMQKLGISWLGTKEPE
ncbi:hypothetical protein QBC45DRAFT_104929 [Copromyces sp. CBS 386.78]|nr:hypothetical protein QBC45DRAFT_104929 [Copromyces sp. CBS 386.78]